MAMTDTHTAPVEGENELPRAELEKRLADPRPRRSQRSSAMQPADVDELCFAIERSARDAGYRYRELHPSGYERLRTGGSTALGTGRKAEDGSPTGTGDTLTGTHYVRRLLEDACDALRVAYPHMQRAQNALTDIAKAIDAKIPVRIEPADDRQRGERIGVDELIGYYERKLEELYAEKRREQRRRQQSDKKARSAKRHRGR